jgi:signal peptidase I
VKRTVLAIALIAAIQANAVCSDPVTRAPRRLGWKTAGVIVFSAFLTFKQVLIPVQVTGTSMEPTYHNHSLNLANGWNGRFGNPKRGEVVVVRQEFELLLKRIVAMPGETVEIEEGKLLINGVMLRDAFSKNLIAEDFPERKLGSNEYFLIGDNRSTTIFMAVQREQILGKLIF